MKGREGGSKFEGAGDKFGDYLCVDCANLPCKSGHNQLTKAKVTRPITRISKSRRELGERGRLSRHSFHPPSSKLSKLTFQGKM